jgi:nitroreductase
MKPPLESIIEYASLAPSQHNTQPWKFSITGHYIKLYPDFKRALPVVDPDNHELYISLGCVLENFIIAANHFGYDANVMYDLYSEEENILIHLYETKIKKFEPLFPALEKRHVNRKGYNGEEIPVKIPGIFNKAVGGKGCLNKNNQHSI